MPGPRAREVAVVAEELGRAVAPTPFLGSTVLATAALLGVHAAGERTSPGRSGSSPRARGQPRSPSRCRPRRPGGPFGAVTVAGDGTLSGTVTSVADAATAGVLVVPAAGDAGPGLYLVEAADARVEPVPHAWT